ncbi:MAG: S41 family peptidase [Candidatus Hydrogenedentes bacterium]|nr:S41 family peptidase [Candidatus Hydrogenedentota bacterium]
MRNHRSQFLGLLCFLTLTALLLSNGFVARIRAQEKVDVFEQINPIGVVLEEIMKNYVEEPDIDKVVEGALTGMMNSLDDHSSYIPPTIYEQIIDDTEGEFDGIGIKIQLDEDKNISVFQPMAGSPAAKAGMMGGDLLLKIDDISTKGMSLDEAAKLIRGPRGTIVHLKVLRRSEDENTPPQFLDLDVTRDKIPLESILESRVLEGGIGYIRVSDFKKTTAHELAERIGTLEKEGMKSLVLDLRWNPGGLLTAAKEVSELFLPKNSLVTYTKGRVGDDGKVNDELTLFTEKEPVLPMQFPIIILVNDQTASSSEIVTGALQFHKRALILGEKTYGKGSVQTIIPLATPKNSALRLTTALYYTPAHVTINKHGILPDIEDVVSTEDAVKLYLQMRDSFRDDPAKQNQQNHGAVTGNEMKEGVVEDEQLRKAVEILKEDSVWENLIAKYHKDTKLTQVAATPADATKAAEDPNVQNVAPQGEAVPQ